MTYALKAALSGFGLTLLVACGSSPGGNAVAPDNQGPVASSPPDGTATQRTFIIPDSPNEEEVTLLAFFNAQDGDTIEWEAGTFTYSKTLQMAHKDGITLRGAGQDQTILDFSDSVQPEGISVSHMDGFTLEDMTVIDTPGFSVKVSDSDHVVMRNMRAMWSSADGNMNSEVPSTLEVSCDYNLSTLDSTGFYTDENGLQRQYTVSSANGGYAIYPVLSNNIVLENVTALGASDAGIYVGQSNHVDVFNSLARFNVAGYEIENTDDADVHDNLADCNTAGFLTFDLPGLSQYGDGTRTYNNRSLYNNTANFAPGGIVGVVPQGTGILALGYDKQAYFNNEIRGNRTLGIVFASHELLDGAPENTGDLRMDLYPEAWDVYGNTFAQNGYSPQPPKASIIQCDETVPGNPTEFPCVVSGIDDGDPSLLPALVVIKGSQPTAENPAPSPRGAHIIWDGMYDRVPFNTNNEAAEPYDCQLAPEHAAKVDDLGKPQYNGSDSPACRYNGYKFRRNGDGSYARDAEGNFIRIHPQYWGCIDPSSNTFDDSAPAFMNFRDTDPSSPASFDITQHDCQAQFGAVLDPLPQATVEAYTPPAGGSARPSEEDITATCEQDTGSAVNREALAFNCTKLSDFNLFADPTDPRSGFNDGGILFDLNTPLFSDYASKYRVAFLPPGSPATWVQGEISLPNESLNFPVGTVIAKTFTFKDGAEENIVETRLIIHREGNNGTFWEGLPYIWETDAAGNRTDARLAIAGGNASVTWNYRSTDVDIDAARGNEPYVGSTTQYSVPTADQCGNCHNNDDLLPGDAPIGPKVRNLNRPMDYNGRVNNQLQEWIDRGLLAGAPTLTLADNIATNVSRIPRFDVPGDIFRIDGLQENQAPGSALENLEVRARSWLEVNCAHCHNPKGLASSTGYFLDVFRAVDLNYGICKTPTTAGSSSGGREEDITPGSALDSVVSFRLHSEDAGEQMPPLARSVAHDEAVAIIDEWINTAVNGSYDNAGCEAGAL